MTALLPCPFCGEADELYPAHRGMGGGKPFAIDCLGCGIDFTPREGADVIAAWNRRAPVLGVVANLLEAAKAVVAIENDNGMGVIGWGEAIDRLEVSIAKATGEAGT